MGWVRLGVERTHLHEFLDSRRIAHMKPDSLPMPQQSRHQNSCTFLASCPHKVTTVVPLLGSAHRSNQEYPGTAIGTHHLLCSLRPSRS